MSLGNLRGAPAPLRFPYLYVNGAIRRDLPEGRRLVASSELTLTDGGPGSTLTASVTAGGITLAMLANLAQATVIGRASGTGTGVPVALTAAQLGALIGAVNGGAMSLVGTVTAGSAQTSLGFSGLDLGTDKAYFFVASFKNATGSAANISLFANSDTTATNYDRQVLTANNTGITGSRAADAFIASMTASADSLCFGLIWKEVGGAPRAITFCNFGVNTSVQGQIFWWCWETAANPTVMDFTSSVAASLDTGSFVRLYKITV